jgi:hypothetical protein
MATEGQNGPTGDRSHGILLHIFSEDFDHANVPRACDKRVSGRLRQPGVKVNFYWAQWLGAIGLWSNTCALYRPLNGLNASLGLPLSGKALSLSNLGAGT